MIQREQGRVTIQLSDDDYDSLVLLLGYSAGAALRTADPKMYRASLRLANVIHDGDPDWQRYDVPEKGEASE